MLADGATANASVVNDSIDINGTRPERIERGFKKAQKGEAIAEHCNLREPRHDAYTVESSAVCKKVEASVLPCAAEVDDVICVREIKLEYIQFGLAYLECEIARLTVHKRS